MSRPPGQTASTRPGVISPTVRSTCRESQSRRHLTAIRALPVHSHQHQLHGICNLVEITGTTAVPVEYKVGRYHPGGPADLQVAGQALCLVESGYQVPLGCVYSVADRKRHEVPVTADLLTRTLNAASRMRELMIRTGCLQPGMTGAAAAARCAMTACRKSPAHTVTAATCSHLNRPGRGVT